MPGVQYKALAALVKTLVDLSDEKTLVVMTYEQRTLETSHKLKGPFSRYTHAFDSGSAHRAVALKHADHMLNYELAVVYNITTTN